jgi:hypothetical protein
LKLLWIKPSTFLLALTALAVSAVPGRAGNITINNFSFESPNVGGAFAFSVTGGWTCTATCVTIAATDLGIFTSAPDGTQLAALGEAGGADNSALSQTLSATLLANTMYTFTFWVGNPSDNAAYSYSGYQAILSANGVTLASDTNAVSPAAGQFAMDTLIFNSGANPAQLGQALAITVNDNFHVGATGFAVDFDDFSLNAVTAQGSTPEPATWMMLAAGLGLVAAAKRRLRK